MKSENGWAEFWSQASQNLSQGWSWSGFERSAFFLNEGGAQFADIGTVLGADQVSDGRGMAAGDIDGDGDLDLVGTCSGTHPSVYVLRNDLKTERHFLLVDVVPSESRPAAGTQLLLTSAGRKQRRDVAIGSGFLTQHSLTQHFGLGVASTVEELEVTWPDGEVQKFEVEAVDQRIVLRQGTGEVAVLPLRERNYNGTGRLAEVEWDSAGSALVRIDEGGPNLRGVTLTDLGGTRHVLGAQEPEGEEAGTYVLLNLWATWCANCKAEIPLLNAAHGAGDLKILGVSVDDESITADVRRVAAAWEIEYPVVHLRGRQLERFQKRTDRLLASEGGLALPTSLLVGPSGKALALARGEVDIENVRLFIESLDEGSR